MNWLKQPHNTQEKETKRRIKGNNYETYISTKLKFFLGHIKSPKYVYFHTHAWDCELKQPHKSARAHTHKRKNKPVCVCWPDLVVEWLIPEAKGLGFESTVKRTLNFYSFINQQNREHIELSCKTLSDLIGMQKGTAGARQVRGKFWRSGTSIWRLCWDKKWDSSTHKKQPPLRS